MGKLFDRAGMTTATTGTGTITLGSAITDATNGDLLTFAEAGVANGNSVNYLLVDGNNFEIGVGSYTSSGTTLSRGAQLSKVGGTKGTAAITLSGTAKVYIVPHNQANNEFKGLEVADGGDIQVNHAGTGGRVILLTSYSGLNMVTMGNGVRLGWENGGTVNTSSLDIALQRDAAAVLAQRVNTTAQSYRIYGTWSSSGTNYERLSFNTTGTGAHRIRSEAGGTGTTRMIQIDGFSQSADPTSSDIPAGAFALVKTTTGGAVKLWYNDGGTMKSVALT